VAAVDAGPAGDEILVEGLFSPAGRMDPHSVLRGSGQIGCRHASARRILGSANFLPAVVSPSDFELFRMFARWMISLDGDRHHTMRRAFGNRFAPRTIETYRKRIQATANTLVAAALEHGRMDLVGDFARPLPLRVICDVLGVPAEDVAWVDRRMITLGQGFAHQREVEFLRAASDAATELQVYFGALLDARRAAPSDDVLSELARELPDDDEARADALANCVLFVIAGHATTTSLISAGTLLLLENGETPSPDEIPTAVEEMLRLVSPTSVVVTRAAQADEIDDCPIAAGEHRFVFLAAANRDPDVFPDPDSFDMTRSPNPHLTFSAGQHYCLGAPLARLHGEVAIGTLLARLPGLRLDGEPEWRGSFPLRELERLPVVWDGAQPDPGRAKETTHRVGRGRNREHEECHVRALSTSGVTASALLKPSISFPA
jgi:cytochrome P450